MLIFFIYLRDVRIDTGLNKFIWSQGVKNIPKRVRVRLSRKRNEDEDAKEKVPEIFFFGRNHIFITAYIVIIYYSYIRWLLMFP